MTGGGACNQGEHNYKRIGDKDWTDPLSGRLFETVVYQCADCGNKKWVANEKQRGLNQYE